MTPKSRLTAMAAAAAVFAAATLAASPAFDMLSGLSLDALTALRWRSGIEQREAANSPTVVIALDEETYDSPPFKGVPTLAWTREIGRTIGAVLDGGASVVGFDVVFPTSIEESQIAFDGETIGARMRGFDRDYLRALAAAAKDGKIVLGEAQIAEKALLPSAGQRAAVGQLRNIRSLNVYSDPDDVVRRAPLTFGAGAGASPSMALELASRALGARPEIGGGVVSVAGYAIPVVGANEMILNFVGGADSIPSYSLADLHACLEKGDRDFFRRNFAGKVVLVGSTFDQGDLKLTSKRFANGPDGRETERCSPRPKTAAAQPRDTINGVYIHATAVNNIIRREAAIELSRPLKWLVCLGGASLGAAAALTLAPAAIAATFALFAATWTAIATAIFVSALALPLFEPMAAAFIALIITAGYRLFIADRDKLALRRNFELYLAPQVVAKMLKSHAPPTLGGEIREVTALFFDLVGYSTIAEQMKPAELVALINRYLSAMTEVIEAHGGFVDKYVGDAIVAIFGAPAAVANHAADAVRAALACNAALAKLNESPEAACGTKLAHRVGVNSGQALVGNIGSKRRFNYTAIGDSVNIAARLESANRHFGTTILASQATMEAAGDAFFWREIDTVTVKGRHQPIRVFEPLAAQGSETPEQRACAIAYAEGLSLWRQRNFPAAAQAFARCANDSASTLFRARAEASGLRQNVGDWTPVYRLD